ncbi:hypothetical protein JSQ81_07660 [Sporosarcina sp. Marseille-Q4063]|uniref:hypothetical protein n=1 Tax=Sporosarcina sp. Marseille-Q4063 TaxID=2810514 RepID=UPI001BAE6AAC|nr:hypothetical protein [Sporosarcina sp. Marseille-Q4063]QUW23390.1 hypothetical protein JSQ81_07660 [Sporosarcina sp. Marseille-Q4063]
MSTSPFSLSHEWSLYWTRIPSNIKRSNFVNGESPKERKALEALAAVGVIGGAQISRLFSLDKKRLKRMVAEKKIVRHEIHRNKQVIPIYTLGINGAVIAGLNDCYESNYWVEYKIEDVLKRLLFFQLFKHFPKAKFLPTQEPFSGVIQFQGKPIYVYVVRGDVNDLLMYLKWNGKNFNERLIIIAESIKHLQPLKVSAATLKLRVALDEDLRDGVKDLQNLFYFLDEAGEFIRELKLPGNYGMNM